MSKIEVKHMLRTERNPNDCWNLALAFALDSNYEAIRKLMKPFMNSNGELLVVFSIGLLLKNGFKEISFEDEVFTVEGVIKLMDSKNNYLIIYIDDHIFYVEDKTIYDSSEDVEALLKQNVNSIMYKEMKEL